MLPALESDARAFLSNQLGGIDTSAVPFEAVTACVGQAYPGGWPAYEADFLRFHTAQAPTLESLSPIQQFSKLRQHVGGRGQRWVIRPHMEIISVVIGETECKAVIKIAKTDERATRDRVTYGLKLTVWKLVGPHWTIEEVEVWDEESVAEFVKWGRVRTPQYVAEQREQFETCFRPGTTKSPLQGPAARLGVSHREFHNLSKGEC